jgi:uncharacterized protein
MKYFRLYPWGMQLVLFLLMVFTFMSSAGAIILGVFTKITGFMPGQLSSISPASPVALIKAAIVVQGFNSAFVYLLPALTFAYLCHPEPMKYLGLQKPGKMIQPLLVVLIMAGAMPVLMMIEHLIALIDFGKDVKAAQEANENVFRAFMQMPHFVDFIRVFTVIAIVVPIGEELFFRGVMMRFARKRSRSMVFPVVFTAVVFSFSHANVYGYLSIFLAGMLLAVIYNLTGSLWCSIIAHTFFNGSQVLLSYLGNSNTAIKAMLESDSIPYGIVAGGAILFAASFYLLLKNRTPLPPQWSDDFTPEEQALMNSGNKTRLL